MKELSVSTQWSKWLPTRGNVILTLMAVAVLVLAQTTGILSLAAQDDSPADSPAGLVAYQGRLADSDGNPLTGTYNMIFRLYESSGAGALPLWEEQWTGPNSVGVSDGLFNVMLGSLNPIPQEVVTGNATLWLGITVDTDDEMSPRVQLGSVPFAVQANTVPDESITSIKIADGTIQAVDMAPDAIPPGVPVGTVISWWRPDAGTPLPSDEWAIADGSAVGDTESPLYGQTLPNLTNRFVMGVGADNIGQTGGANTVNLAHSHQVASHSHSIPTHRHTLDHDHNTSDVYCVGGGSTSVHRDIIGVTVENTGAWSGSTGASQPNTDSRLSSATENRPAYVGLLYLVKIK